MEGEETFLIVFNFEGFKKHSSIAQSVERMTVNHDVVGSSPTGGAKEVRFMRIGTSNLAPWSSG